MTPPSSLRVNNFGMSTASWPNMAQPPPTLRSVRAYTRRRATNGSRYSFPAPTLRPPPRRPEEADQDARKILACQFRLAWAPMRPAHPEVFTCPAPTRTITVLSPDCQDRATPAERLRPGRAPASAPITPETSRAVRHRRRVVLR